MDTCDPSALERTVCPTEGRRSARAFSLVEVTLALGIFAFALTAIFGLLPLGLTSFRQAMDASTCSQICQQVINDAQQADFNALTATAFRPTLRYFDEQGNEVPAATATSTANSFLYEVNTVIAPMTGWSNSTAAPIDTASANLAAVTVQIIKNPGNKAVKGTPQWADASFTIYSYSGFVARNQGPP